MTGGGGVDSLSGGTGADLFVVDAKQYLSTTYDQVDRITDFSVAEGDRIDVSSLGISEFANLQQFIIDTGADATVQVLHNGVATGFLLAGLADPSTLTAAQFIFSTAVTNDYLNGGAGRDDLFGGLGNDNITSSTGNDRLFGEAGNDVLNAGSDNDTVFGGAGNDTVYGAYGRDSIVGGTGDDLLFGEYSGNYYNGDADTLVGDAGNDALFGGSGNDTLDGGADNDALRGGLGVDTLTGGSGADTFFTEARQTIGYGFDGQVDRITDFSVAEGDRIDVSSLGISEFGTLQQFIVDVGADATVQVLHNSGATGFLLAGLADPSTLTAAQFIFSTATGNDVLSGSAGRDDLFGGLGSDSLYGGADDDRLFGESGRDRLLGATGKDTLTGGDGNDTLFGDYDGYTGSDSADALFGGAGNDSLHGGGANDSLDGGFDNDTLRGGVGVDTLTGGTGADVFVVDAKQYLSAYDGQVDRISDFSVAEGDRIDVSSLGISEFETVQQLLVDVGSDATFQFMRTGAATGLLLAGLADPSTLTAAQFILSTANVADVQSGSNDRDDFFAGLGNDRAYGAGGADRLFGESGKDSLYGGTENDSLFGGAGNDSLFGGYGADSLSGGDGNDVLTGDYDSATYLFGADVLSGGAGDDSLRAGAGNDTLDGGNDADSLNGGDGSDNLQGGDGADRLFGDNTSATSAGDGGDTISGGAGADSLFGGGGSDVLEGGAGNDSIEGNAGNNDRAVFSGNWVDYTITGTAGTSFTIVDNRVGSPDGTDTVSSVEFFTFNGATGTAAQITNVGPVGVNDVNAPDLVVEAGGTGNGSGGDSTATGSVLGNDTDGNAVFGEVLSLNAARLGSEAAGGALTTVAGSLVLTGSFGSLTLNADGTYTYTLDQNNPTVEAMVAGATLSDLFTYRVADAKGLTDLAQLTITINGSNDAPVITSNGGGAAAAISVAENTTAVGTVTSTDVDTGATRSFSIIGGADAALFNINAANGALTFIAAPNFEAPGDAGSNNVYDVRVQVSDGGLTDFQDIAVTVTDANDAPAITSNGGGASAAVSVAENSTAVTTVTSSDPDAGASKTFSISGGADALLFTINAATGALAFAAAPNFELPGDAGNNGVYDVQVQVSDGSLTDVQDIAVTVTDVNEAPVITSDGGGAAGAVSIAENTTFVTTVTSSDVDAGATKTFAITGGPDAVRFSIDAATGVLSFIAAPNFENPTDAGVNNVYDVQVQVSDGSLTDVQLLSITVNNVNDAPVITSFGGGATAAISIGENRTGEIIISSTDQDVGATKVFSISGGADSTLFTIDAVTGVLRFITGRDFETPTDAGANGVYDVQVQVSDGSLTDVQDIAVTVTDLNEAPAITSNGGGAAAVISVVENTTAVTTVAAFDPDIGATKTFSISGGKDAGKFAIDAATGVLSFVTAPNFEAPIDKGKDNVYDLIVKVTDGTLTDTQTLTVNVTDAVFGVTINGTAGADKIDAKTTLPGQPLPTDDADSIIGNDGNDSLDGGKGNDTLVGGIGNDTYTIEGNDVLVEDLNGGTDTVVSKSKVVLGANFENLVISGLNDAAGTGNELNNQISGNKGANVLKGLNGNDSIDGGVGADVLFGGNNDDRLNGGSENDILWGDAGNDIMSGGLGHDMFMFKTGFGSDKIDDFTAGALTEDVLDFTAMGINLAALSITSTAGGASTRITVTATGDTILLAGVAFGTLNTADDLLF